MLLRVSHVLGKIAKQLSGGGGNVACSPQIRAEALERLNDATRLLMLEPEAETSAEICMNICSCCVTLDEQFETITAALLDQRPANLYNETFRYLDSGTGPLSCCEGGCAHELEDHGDGHVLHVDLPRPMHIMAWSERDEADATIIIEGRDERGGYVSQEIPLHRGAKGAPPLFTAGDGKEFTGIFAAVTGLQKPMTNGRVFVHGWEPATQDMPWLTTLERWSESPSHRRYRLPGGQRGLSLQARVTRRWHPVAEDSDVLLIQNIDALENMAAALEAKDAKDFGSYQALTNSAISKLKKQATRQHGPARTALNIPASKGPMRGRTYYKRY